MATKNPIQDLLSIWRALSYEERETLFQIFDLDRQSQVETAEEKPRVKRGRKPKTAEAAPVGV